MANIEKSAFLRGQNDRGWRADIAFVCQASSFAKLFEGGYGNGAHAPAPRPVSAWQPRKTQEDIDSGYLAKVAARLGIEVEA
jgi:hypothetical protein